MEELEMKRTIFIVLLSTLLQSCNNSEKELEREGMNTANMSLVMDTWGLGDIDETTLKLNEEEKSTQNSFREKDFVEVKYPEEHERILQQIEEIFNIDIDGDVITVGGVRFSINVHEEYIVLITNIHIDDLQMDHVIRSISFYHDMMPIGSKSDELYWCANPEYDTCEIVVRMRPLYSANGGTEIIFS